MSSPRLLAIHNPHSSGGGYRREIPLILASLRALGYEVVERETAEPGDGTRIAAQGVAEGVDLVCAIGGDGTVNEVINGLAGGAVPMAIIPTGTVNVLAMELGVPLDPADAVQVLAGATRSRIDLGIAGDRYFALMAGIGMDAAVVASLNPSFKKALREAAFALQGVATYLTREEPLIRVTTAEQTVEGYFVVFGNSSNYGGGLGLTPLADMRDGLLDVCVLKDKSLFTTISYWTAALTSARLRHPKAEYFRTEWAEVATVVPGEEVLVQTDGEAAGKLPITCRVVPDGLSVLVP